MRFLISGASSKFAKVVGSELSKVGHEITIIGRDTSPSFSLEDPELSLPPLLESHEIFIHFAHSFEQQKNLDLNGSSAMKISSAVNMASTNFKKCIYISSDSANLNSLSTYGKSKYRAERYFLESERSAVLRIGIILDKSISSPFSRLMKIVVFTKVLIFPKPSRPIFTVMNIEEILNSIIQLTSDGRTGGPFGIKSYSDRLSILEILRKEGVIPKIVVSLPLKVTEILCSIGKRSKTLRRAADSILSILIEPEDVERISRGLN